MRTAEPGKYREYTIFYPHAQELVIHALKLPNLWAQISTLELMSSHFNSRNLKLLKILNSFLHVDIVLTFSSFTLLSQMGNSFQLFLSPHPPLFLYTFVMVHFSDTGQLLAAVIQAYRGLMQHKINTNILWVERLPILLVKRCYLSRPFVEMLILFNIMFG